MNTRFWFIAVVAAAWFMAPFAVSAQTLDFDVLIDSDRSASTGCAVTPSGGATLNGFEHRLRATVDTGSAEVIALERASCGGGAFGAPVPVSGVAVPYPLALNTGIGGSDAVELAVARGALGGANLSQLRLTFVTDSGSGSDVLATTDGSAGGGPIVLGLPVQIPALSIWGLGALVLVLLTLAWLTHRRMGRVGAVMAVMLVTTAAWAMTFALDGDLSDWAGRAPNATDPGGDATDGSAAIDLVAAFVALDNDELFFRIDVVDTENQAPAAADDAFDTDEDVALSVAAPGVLGNDSDGDGDPLTAVLASGPANAQTFALNADGSFDYTPAADFNGSDSFSYFANDGQADSAAATVTITVNAVNDPPLAVDDNATTNEDQQVGIDVLTNDSDVDGNLDPAAVSVVSGPANGTTSVDAGTGVITYTKSADFNGNDSFDYEVCDDGLPLPAQCSTATVSITVDAVNDAPAFTAGADVPVDEDSGPQSIAGWATGISAGPPDESGQALTFNVTGNTNPGLFSAGPSVNAAGDLSFTSAPDANGNATITLNLSDDGGTANGGVDTSPSQSFTITVDPVNDAPSFTAGADPTVLEDAGPQTVAGWATGISSGPADETGQSLTFNVTGNTNPGLFAATPVVDSTTGDLSYTPADDATGSATITLTLGDDGGTASGGVDTSPAQSFTINVTPINDAPAFTAGADVTVNEDSGAQSVAGWATGISAGPSNESGQALTFNVTGNTNPGLFSAGPSVNAAGDLSFTSAPDANGSATITLELMDDGGTANGGVDTSPTQSFTITVDPVNDAPSFAAGADPTVLEDAGPQTVAGWATGINAGAADESGQVLTFNITGNDNTGLFSAGPALDPTSGNLTFTPAADANGTANITVELTDNGGTANGGVDTSPTQTFAINVTAVNDAPTFTVISNPPAVDEDAGSVITGGAFNISPGPADEAGQTLTFTLTQTSIDSTLSFSAAPTIDASTGNLSHTPAPNAYGSASFNVVLTDDGGTANGGQNTSPAQSLTITITPVNDPPVPVNHTLTTHSATRITLGSGDSELLKDGATDVDDPSAALSVSPLVATSTNGAVLTLVDSATGTYQYDPPGGLTGSDSFTYEVCDSATTAAPVQCATATVNVTVTGPPLWVVDPAAPAGGDGSLNRPFQALSNLPGGRATGGRVFLASGTNSGGHGYVANERLIGRAATGNTFDGFFGVQIPTNGTLDGRPVMGGVRPTVQGQVTLANGVLARGFNIAPASGTRGLVGSGAWTGIDVSQMAIATVNATAVDLNGPTGNFTLDSVNANGGANGIVLINTNSASGSFTVTGTGGTCTAATPTCSGGRIQATTGTNGAVPGNGIYLQNTRSVSLTRMRVGGHQNHAIFGNTVTGFTLTDSLVDGVNGNDAATDEGSVRFTNLLGSGAITRSDLSGGLEDNLRLVNSTGTLDRLMITDTIFRDNSNSLGNDGILIEASGTAVVNVTVDNSDFSAHRGDHFDAAATDSAALDLVFTNNGMSGGHPSPLGQSFILSNAQSSDVSFDVSGNTITDAVVTAFIFFQSASSTTGSSIVGTFNNNTVGTAGAAGSGSSQGSGVLFNANGNGTMTVLADGNTIRQWSNPHGMEVAAGDGSPVVDATVTNNLITERNTSSFPLNGLHLNAGTTFAGIAQVCLDVRNNDMVSASADTSIETDFRFRQRNQSAVRLPGYVGAAGDTAAVIAFVQGNNTGTPSGSGAANTTDGTGFTGGAACVTP